MSSYMVNKAGRRVCHRGHVMRKQDIYVEKRRDGSQRERCKHCRRKNLESFRIKNPDYFKNKSSELRKTALYRDKAKLDRLRYRQQWLTYFKDQYGARPCCQICRKRLYWTHKQHGKRVCFDHRHGQEAIIEKSPRTWIQNKPCNEDNIALWESCDFGLLCSNCNAMLPTKDRGIFSDRLLEYLELCTL
jgi:hypothetical protein